MRLPCMRGIGRTCHVQVNEGLRAGRIARVIRSIGLLAGRGELRSARGLRILPDDRFGCARLRRCQFGVRHAAGRGRALIASYPKRQCRRGFALSNVLRGGDRATGAVRDGDTGAIDAAPKSRSFHGVCPCEEICLLPGKQASALFDIEEDDGRGSKALPQRCLRRGVAVGCSARAGIARDQFLAGLAIKQERKAEAGAGECDALALPRVRLLSRRVVEPVPCPGEALAKLRQRAGSGIIIAVESLGRLGRARSGKQQNQQCKEHGPAPAPINYLNRAHHFN